VVKFDLNHIHVRCSEPLRAAAWWVQAFNFTIVSDRIAPWGGRSVTCRSENGLDVRFSKFDGEQRPAADPWSVSGDHLDHLGFTCADIDAEAARLIALGAVPVGAPTGGANIPGRYHFFQTPGNVIVELNPPHA